MDSDYYQLPENSDSAIKKMVWGLVSFFSFLIVLVILIVVYAQEIAVNIPFSAEQRFVRPYEDIIRKWYPDDGEDNQEQEQYLTELATELSQAMGIPDDIKVTVHYVDLEITNAFATLGGHVFIFKGLIDEMPDENSLAMVLAHELAHIQHRDPVAAMGRGFAIQMLYGFVTNDYSGGADLVSMSGEAGMSFFSRDQETTADLKALEALNTHYGHVGGHDEFFIKMLRETQDNEDLDEHPVQWLSTHPELQKRIDYMNEKVVAENWLSKPTKPFPDFLVGEGLYSESESPEKETKVEEITVEE